LTSRISLHSIGEISRLQRIVDSDASYVAPHEMLSELREDNNAMAKHMRRAHGICEDAQDIATASLLENWIDETERRAWFLYEASNVSAGEAG
jgi:starvation-inducible DNA-binding protein